MWAASNSARLPRAARTLIEKPDNELFFSSASIWELAIKQFQSRSGLNVNANILYHGLAENGYRELAITSTHTLGVAELPALHNDPFDRLLISQAAQEGLLLLTRDSRIADYPGPIRLV